MSRPPRHPVLKEVLKARREVRAAYQDHLEAQISMAEEDCRGILLNALGRRRGIDPASLFMGQASRACKYASEELLDWWMDHPRVTFTEWEHQSGTYASGMWGLALAGW